MSFRLFFLILSFNFEITLNLPSLIYHSIKRLKQHISHELLNLMIIKKLWTPGHAICYIMDDGNFIENLHFAYGRG